MPKVKASLSENNRMEEMKSLLEDAGSTKEESTENNENYIADLKNLILLGRLVHTFKINGFEFEIATLSVNEQSDVMRHLMKQEDMERVLNSKSIALAYCIKKINSVPLSDLSAEHEGDDVYEKNVSFILNMQALLVDKIFSEYEELTKRASEKVGFEAVKK